MAFARMKLYDTLKSIGSDRLAYCYTDSVVFETRHGQWKPESGNFMGQLQDEIQNEFGGGYLGRFVCLGSKIYGMEIVAADQSKRCELHCKGISLNLRSKKVINFESMLNVLKNNRTGNLVMEDPYFIRRIKQEALLACVYLRKKLQFTFKKRCVNFETFETVPLGYQCISEYNYAIQYERTELNRMQVFLSLFFAYTGLRHFIIWEHLQEALGSYRCAVGHARHRYETTLQRHISTI